MINLFFQTPIGQIGGPTGFGPWGNLGSITDTGISARAFTQILSQVIGVMTIIAGIWFILQFIIASFGFLTAGGNQGNVKKAWYTITHTLIGLVVVVAAYALISLFGSMLGFDILNPQSIILLLKPKP